MSIQSVDRTGKIKYGILGWLIGLPLPIIIILLFVKGCDFCNPEFAARNVMGIWWGPC